MRRLAVALRSLITDLIGPEGVLLAAGFAGLVVIAWSIDWRAGVAVASIAALALGLAVAKYDPKPPRTP